MNDELSEIRRKKMEALRSKVSDVQEKVDEIQAMQREFTWSDFGFDEPEWGFRESGEMPGAFDVCQRGQTVALTGDPKWAMLVTDLLNRARLEELTLTHGGESDEEEAL
jgi:hypothetical protein